MASHCESLLFILPTPSDCTLSTSPSVYIAYNGLEAFVSCTPYGNVARGKAYNTTIAYAPAYLSTSISARAEQTCAFTEIIYTELANYPYSDGPSLILSLPSELSSVDPAWSTCVPNSYGAFDPPTTLRQATALTGLPPDPTLLIHAAPGGHVGVPYSPATTTFSTSESLSGTPPDPSRDPSNQLKPIDPSDNSPTPGKSRIDDDVSESIDDTGRRISPGTVDDVTKLPPPSKIPYLPSTSEQFIVPAPNKAESTVPTTYASISLAQTLGAFLPITPSDALLGSSAHALPLASALKIPSIVGQSMTRAPDDGIVFASHSISPESHATIAGHTVYTGFTDAVIDGSTYVAPSTTTGDLPPESVTLANGLIVSPYGSPNKVQIGTQVESSDGSAITLPGATISLGTSGPNIGPSVLPFTNVTGSSGPIQRFGTSLVAGGGNGSNAIAFTGRSSKCKDHRSMIVLALLAVTIATTAP